VTPTQTATRLLEAGKPVEGLTFPQGFEFGGVAKATFRGCYFTGGKTNLRLLDIPEVFITDSTFGGMSGPPDPDGQAIQLIRCGGVITGIECFATTRTEDLVSIYGDKASTRSLRLTIQDFKLHGRGDSPSSTSICIDGPHPPQTTIGPGTIQGARVGIQLAGGSNHTLKEGITFEKCQNDVAVHPYYKGAFGPFTIWKGYRVLK